MTLMCSLLLTSALAFGQNVGFQDPPQNPPPNPKQQNPNQPGGNRGRGQANLPAVGPNVPIQELQEYFDTFALMQAQRFLQLDDDQYARFFPRMNRVYQLRRQHGVQRGRLLNEIRRLWGPQRVTEQAPFADVLKRLDDLEAKFVADMRAARLALDEVLDVRQRAGLRFFEEDMERQKVDWMTRSRQGGPMPGEGIQR
jgi:hypothetical protein